MACALEAGDVYGVQLARFNDVMWHPHLHAALLQVNNYRLNIRHRFAWSTQLGGIKAGYRMKKHSELSQGEPRLLKSGFLHTAALPPAFCNVPHVHEVHSA